MKLLTNTLKKTDGPTRSGTAAAALAALLQVGGMVGGMGAISTLAGWPGQARAEAPAAKTQDSHRALLKVASMLTNW